MPINILVGDIGSTKSTWWSNSEGNREFHLTGYNPITHDEAVGKRLFDQLWQVTEGDPFAEIWYYGTGVINDKVAEKVIANLRNYFPKADIHVASDLLGAAKATCGSNAGCLVILGTGSHAAVFDGQQITRQASSLGYILGDEGSGCDIGKELIKAYFYKQMPDGPAADMASLMRGERSEFLQKLYHHDTPNQFLAEFVKVAAQHLEDPWVQNLVSARFTLFIKNHLLPLQPNGPVQVVGSVGTIFAGLFQQVLENNNLQPGACIKDPARRLFEMHLQHE